MANETLQEQIENLQKENNLYKQNGAIGLYYELNRFVNGVVEMMRKQSLEELLTAKKDEDAKKFEKTMTLIKNAKEHVSDMEELKLKLNLTGNEQKDKEKVPFIETVATKRD